MYSDKFLTLTKQLLKFEGGKVNNRNDMGGATAYGITEKIYEGYRKLRGLSVQNIFLISHDEVLEIYFRNYYIPLNIENIIPTASGYIIYDFAVNSGVKNANIFKMHIVIENEDPVHLLDKREEFYYHICQKNPKNIVFLKGWINRLIGISKIYNLNWIPKRGSNA